MQTPIIYHFSSQKEMFSAWICVCDHFTDMCTRALKPMMMTSLPEIVEQCTLIWTAIFYFISFKHMHVFKSSLFLNFTLQIACTVTHTREFNFILNTESNALCATYWTIYPHIRGTIFLYCHRCRHRHPRCFHSATQKEVINLLVYGVRDIIKQASVFIN